MASLRHKRVCIEFITSQGDVALSDHVCPSNTGVNPGMDVQKGVASIGTSYNGSLLIYGCETIRVRFQFELAITLPSKTLCETKDSC